MLCCSLVSLYPSLTITFWPKKNVYAAAQPSAVVGSTEIREAARVHHFRQLEAFKVFSVFNLLDKHRMPNFASQ